MGDKIDYKFGLLYFYWLMAGADGNRSTNGDDPEWLMMQKMKKHEGISDEELNEFLNADLGREEDQLKKILFALVIARHSERVRALAWMDLIMFADGYLHDNEEFLYNKVRNKFEIDEYEITNVKSRLIEATKDY